MLRDAQTRVIVKRFQTGNAQTTIGERKSNAVNGVKIDKSNWGIASQNE